MNINEEILEILTEYKINKDDGLCYLMSLHHNLKPSYIPDTLKQKMHLTKIYEADKGSLKWNIALFEGHQTAFDWVKEEYCKMFKECNSTRGGNVRESTLRLKKLFEKNPEIRKDDVINATRMYLKNTNATYIMYPHYFIEKGDGATKTSTILDWIDKYKESNEIDVGKNHVSNTMQ